MAERILAVNTPLIVVLLVGCLPAAQDRTTSKAAASSTVKASAAKRWLTPWGDPDLQGSWSNTAWTPLERPAKYAGRELMTPQERAEEEKRRVQQERVAFYDPSWSDGRTSLIYDPPDGLKPPLTPEAQKRQIGWNESLRTEPPGPINGPEDLNLRTRCIIRDPLPRIPANYVNNYEIVQGPGFVSIFQESTHETRVIPLDGRPHLDQRVRQWFGDSRGHWEGDTLVVDVTNFNNRTRFEGSTENMHLVERWKRVADDRIDYRFTVSDPATWTKPWSAAIAWNKSGPVYEYACHEDNIDMYAILSVARAADRKAGEAAKKSK
jgi:hypothetical protein